MPAGVAVDAGKPVVRIATAQEALARALLHRAAKATRFAKLLAVALHAAPKRTCARVARAALTLGGSGSSERRDLPVGSVAIRSR